MSNLYHAGVSMQKPMSWVLDQFAPNNKVETKELPSKLDSSTTESKTNHVGLTAIKRFAAIFVVFIGAPLYVIGAIFKVLGAPVTKSESQAQTIKVEPDPSSDKKTAETTSSKTHTFGTTIPLSRTTSSSNLQSQKTSKLQRTASFGATPQDTSSLFLTKSQSSEQTKKIDTESSRSIIKPYASLNNTVLYYTTLSQPRLPKATDNSEETANKAPEITPRKKRINQRTLLNLRMKRNTDTSKQTEKTNQATKPSNQLGGGLADQVAAIARKKQDEKK